MMSYHFVTLFSDSYLNTPFLVRNVSIKEGINLQTHFPFSADQNGFVHGSVEELTADTDFFFYKFTFLELAATKDIFNG